ncbi:hypothetical protein H0H81_008883 [Sphagnurus paluster]|uniref:Uncharacterized protein n=1 Tax=Sphagnurus paluster TaxID=117069 RepID=A0A9P7GIR2_9AGAR|nr:hypothetical protein H0H81_008883 [Sphagnurus paluster]
MPQPQVLAAQVDGTVTNSTIALNPPSGGWPTGGSFRLNLVKDVNDLNTILAQSSQFSIKAPVSSSSSQTTTSGTTLVVTTTPTQPAATTGNTAGFAPPGSSATPASNGVYKALAPAGLVTLLAGLTLFV